MHHTTLFRDKKFQNFSVEGQGAQPISRPHPPVGRGTPSPHPRHRRLDPRHPLSWIRHFSPINGQSTNHRIALYKLNGPLLCGFNVSMGSSEFASYGRLDQLA